MCMRLKCCRELRDIVDMCLMIVMTMKKILIKKSLLQDSFHFGGTFLRRADKKRQFLPESYNIES